MKICDVLNNRTTQKCQHMIHLQKSKQSTFYFLSITTKNHVDIMLNITPYYFLKYLGI